MDRIVIEGDHMNVTGHSKNGKRAPATEPTLHIPVPTGSRVLWGTFVLAASLQVAAAIFEFGTAVGRSESEIENRFLQEQIDYESWKWQCEWNQQLNAPVDFCFSADELVCKDCHRECGDPECEFSTTHPAPYPREKQSNEPN